MIDGQELMEEVSQNRLREIIEDLVPGGEWDRDGSKYFAAGYDGGQGKSFSFDVRKNVGGDFATDEKMTNILGIWMHVNDVDYPTAIRELAEHIGSDLVDLDAEEQEKRQRKSKEDRERIAKKEQAWSQAWYWYGDYSGTVGGYVSSQADNGRVARKQLKALDRDCAEVYDWLGSVKRLADNPEAISLIAQWRNYREPFVREMIARGWIGLSECGKIEFPVQDYNSGIVCRTHRLVFKDEDTKNWVYSDGDTPVTPLVIDQYPDSNKRYKTHLVIFAESQWDLFAFLQFGYDHCSNQIGGPRWRAICTRGKNGISKVDLDRVPNHAVIVALAQNDHPNAVWLHKLFELIQRDNPERKIMVVRPPKEFKDLNDWCRTAKGRKALWQYMDDGSGRHLPPYRRYKGDSNYEEYDPWSEAGEFGGNTLCLS